MNKNQINNKSIAATKQIKTLQTKYGISQEDLMSLSRAYAVHHLENILTETQSVLSDVEKLEQPQSKARAATSQLNWIVTQAEREFGEVRVTRSQLARL